MIATLSFGLPLRISTADLSLLSGEVSTATTLILASGVRFLYSRNDNDALEAEIENLIEARQLARKAKDFAESDRIREQLKNMGIVLEDTPLGVKWRRAVADAG